MRAFILVVAMLLLSSVLHATPLPTMSWPKQQLGRGANGVPFVENSMCQQCHPQAFRAWRGSHHERAMQLANEKTVLGGISTTPVFTHQGITSRFYTRDGQFFVHTQGPDGQMADFPDSLHVWRGTVTAVFDPYVRRSFAEPHHCLGYPEA